MMAQDDAIIAPRRGRRPPIPAAAILALGQRSWQALAEQLESRCPHKRDLHLCSLWVTGNLSCAGPVFGAPAAVMVLEQLIALGARAVFALGLAGSLQPTFTIATPLLPLGAISEEGTSPHYFPGQSRPIVSPQGIAWLRQQLQKREVSWQEGLVWTTDAPYRELRSKVKRYQAGGVHGVDMETSALFTVARFRNIATATLLVISDELFTLSWRPGFGQRLLRERLTQLATAVLAALESPADLPQSWE